MVIRRLTKADIAAVVEIDQVSFSAYDQYGLQYYDERIASDAFEAFCVEDDSGTIVGWALTDLRRDPIRIRSLSIRPECRKRGFATALINAAIGANSAPIDLLVEPRNTAAIALYEKLGFRVAAPDPEMPARVRMLRTG